MSQLNRRNALVAAAALPALAVPAAAVAAVAPHPDAELMTLGEQFGNLFEQWLPLYAEESTRGHEAHNRAWELAEYDPSNRYPTKEECDRYMQHLKATEASTGLEEFSRRAHETARELEIVAERIMDLPAHSVGGLRAKALVAMYGNIHAWKHLNDDYADRTLRTLVEALAGPARDCAELFEAAQMKAQAASDDRVDAEMIELEHEVTRCDAEIEARQSDYSDVDEFDALVNHRNDTVIKIFKMRANGWRGLEVQARIWKLQQSLDPEEGDYPLGDVTMGNALAEGILQFST